MTLIMKGRYFERKFLNNPQNYYFACCLLIPSLKKLEIIMLSIGGADYSYRYQLQPIVLVIGTDYAYGQCIGTALLHITPNYTLHLQLHITHYIYKYTLHIQIHITPTITHYTYNYTIYLQLHITPSYTLRLQLHSQTPEATQTILTRTLEKQEQDGRHLLRLTWEQCCHLDHSSATPLTERGSSWQPTS